MAGDAGDDLLPAHDADDNCRAEASQPSELSGAGRQAETAARTCVTTTMTRRSRLGWAGLVRDKDVAFYCRCPQIVITRVAAMLQLQLAAALSLSVCLSFCLFLCLSVCLPVPVTVVQEIQICKISRGRTVG